MTAQLKRAAEAIKGDAKAAAKEAEEASLIALKFADGVREKEKLRADAEASRLRDHLKPAAINLSLVLGR